MPLVFVTLHGADGPTSDTGQGDKRDGDWNGDASQHLGRQRAFLHTEIFKEILQLELIRFDIRRYKNPRHFYATAVTSWKVQRETRPLQEQRKYCSTVRKVARHLQGGDRALLLEDAEGGWPVGETQQEQGNLAPSVRFSFKIICKLNGISLEILMASLTAPAQVSFCSVWSTEGSVPPHIKARASTMLDCTNRHAIG